MNTENIKTTKSDHRPNTPVAVNIAQSILPETKLEYIEAFQFREKRIYESIHVSPEQLSLKMAEKTRKEKDADILEKGPNGF